MTSRRIAIVVSAALVAAIALVYFPVWRFGFVPLDDPAYVVNNAHVTSGLSWDNIRWALTSRYAGYWIPLTWISYMAEVQAAGVQPGVMHVTNVLLHVINTLLLFGWLRRTTGATGRSACVAALFALHPLHVESVAWITERKDVLSTLFLLLALITYTQFTRRRTPGRYLVVCALFIAGLMAKPMLVTMPLVLLLADIWPLGRVPLSIGSAGARASWRRAILEKAPLAAIAAVASLVVFFAQQEVGAMVPLGVFPFGLRVENAFVSAVLYLAQTAWPTGLVAWYAYPDSIPIWQVIGAVTLLAAITTAACRALTRPYLAVGWFWYLVTLAPVSGLIQVGTQPRADRFMYVPLVGIFVVVAWGVAELATRWRIGAPVLVAAGLVTTLVFGAMSHRQVMYWQDGTSLWRHAVDVMPGVDGTQAQFELGKSLAAAGNSDEALAHFSEAIRFTPEWAPPYAARGRLFASSGRRADAEADFEQALRLEPNLPETHNELGGLLVTNGQPAAALTHFQDAVRLRPGFTVARVNLGITLATLGRRDEAIRELTTALEQNPADATAREVLASLMKAGKDS